LSQAPSKESVAQRIERHWYGRAWGNLWLLPLWALFVLVSGLRRQWYRWFPVKSYAAPVLVVGNIAIGGTGKTPLITLLAQRAQELGLNVGVVSRGYGGQPASTPLRVDASTPVSEAGDEPALLAGRGIDVMVDPVRANAVRALIEQGDVDLVLSDDGLQHYAMHRDAELVVSDATRGHGNGWCLPVGPLREPISRLASVDLHAVNGRDFHIEADQWVSVLGCRSLDELRGLRVHAVAGIGNPDRFFNTLHALGVAEVIEHPFPDHHAFSPDDFNFADPDSDNLGAAGDLPVVMTEKDWVKCRNFNDPRLSYISVKAVPTDEFNSALTALLTKLGEQSRG